MYVIMLHSVGNNKSDWHRNWLSVSLEHFETLCQYLVRKGYTTHFLDEWYDYSSQPRKKNPKKLVLTFDDGYLDNWVFAYPILKKYGLKGTIFINPEFVEPIAEVRPTIEDIWKGKIAEEDLTTLGFLNWEELRAMQRSGVMDIQSHSMSHNTYFKSNKLVDIYTGQPHYDWVSWYLEPQKKPFGINPLVPDPAPYGYPVFESDRALRITRYFPQEELIQKCVELYQSNKPKEQIIEQVQEIIKEFPGRYETLEELEERYRYELFESKTILEVELNKPVDFLCWPGGGYNDFAVELSKEAGYKASTISSGQKDISADNHLQTYKRIKRFGMGGVFGTQKGYYRYKNRRHLIRVLKSQTGNLFLLVIIKLHKEFIRTLYRFKISL